MEERKCTGCGETYPYTSEFFNYRNKTKGTLQRRCKSCTRKDIKKSKIKNGSECFNFNVSARDRKMIEKNAERIGLTLSQYLRYVAMKNQPIIITDLLVEVEPVEKAIGNIEYFLRKLGNNCNQIAKSLNSGGGVSQETIDALVNVLEKLNLKMANIEKTIGKAYQNFD